jgi:putative DNA primase/helicase
MMDAVNGWDRDELPVWETKPRPPAFTDDDLALRFADRHVDDLRYVAVWAKWMHYAGTIWATDETRLAFTLARAICREAASKCNKEKTASALASAKTRAAVITLANDDRRLAATTDQWDFDPDAINTPLWSLK